MAFLVKDRVQETCAAPGTGTLTLLGAATGYQSFSSAIGANNTTFYTIADQGGANWEVGLGTIGAGGTTLARTTIFASSNGGSVVNFSSGIQNVWCDYPAGKAAIQDASGVVTVPVLATNSTVNTTPTLSFNASNSAYAGGASVSGNYLQFLLQNKSGTAGASTNYVLSNDLGTDSTYYGEFGMNSSVFSASTPSDFFSINNGIYFSGHDGDITVGSGNGYKYYMAWGTTGQSAHVINASGAIGFSTNLGTTPALSGTTGYGTAGQPMLSGGSSAPPTYGTLGIAGGGTNSTATPTSGGVGYGTGTAHAYTAAGTSNQVLISNGSSAPSFTTLAGSGISEFAAGTALLFQQTTAPTGWTKVTTNDNAALRVVSGTVGTGGTVAFTTAFASQTPAGSVSTSVTAVSGSVSTSTSIGNTYLNDPYYMPSHNHTVNIEYIDAVTGHNHGSQGGYVMQGSNQYQGRSTDAGVVYYVGSGGYHSHSGSSSSSFTFSSGTASSSFSGTAINLAVKYVDVIIATKN